MPRVLIVEDDSVLMEVLRQAFRAGGWDTDGAPSAADALAALKAQPADVLLTDKNLPGGQSGVELIREVRKSDRAIGIVMMTGYGSVESARETLNLGVDEYLEKPFDNIFRVVDRLRALGERAQARRASPGATVGPGPLTILIAAAAQRRAYIARHLQGLRDRLLYVDNPEEIKPSARSERADLVILDGGSFPEEITCLVAELKARARFAACLVLSEHLALSDVKRLIELEVKALIDDPPESDRFGLQLSAAVERLRKAAGK